MKKPWGYEYLAYENEYVGLVVFTHRKRSRNIITLSSKKDTGLIVLDGAVNVSFLNDITRLIAGRKVMIRKGLFIQLKLYSKKVQIFLKSKLKDKAYSKT